ncbi:MAG: PTS glucose transporter subunit IIA [Tissierellia bacterium]|nr:PTS glucose transporter subunit IIA [Tissierellia bacterium]
MGLFGTKIKLLAPFTGKSLDITEVKDETFSQKFLGDGIAVDPKEEIVVAPASGKIIQVFKTKHAFLMTSQGLELLVHIGMNTVEMKGEGFEYFVNDGDMVEAGQKVAKINLDLIHKKGYNLETPIVITNMDVVKKMDKNFGDVVAGKDVVMTIKI